MYESGQLTTALVSWRCGFVMDFSTSEAVVLHRGSCSPWQAVALLSTSPWRWRQELSVVKHPGWKHPARRKDGGGGKELGVCWWLPGEEEQGRGTALGAPNPASRGSRAADQGSGLAVHGVTECGAGQEWWGGQKSLGWECWGGKALRKGVLRRAGPRSGSPQRAVVTHRGLGEAWPKGACWADGLCMDSLHLLWLKLCTLPWLRLLIRCWNIGASEGGWETKQSQNCRRA